MDGSPAAAGIVECVKAAAFDLVLERLIRAGAGLVLDEFVVAFRLRVPERVGVTAFNSVPPVDSCWAAKGEGGIIEC
jgi:hypothetical protein